MYSEQDLENAAKFREELHREALARVRAVFPCADCVVDKYPAEAYLQKVWEYPGKWYTVVGTPPEVRSRKGLIEAIARETLKDCRCAGVPCSEAGFYRLMAEYPDIRCEFNLIHSDEPHAQAMGVFPYLGEASHLLALKYAECERSSVGKALPLDIKNVKCRKLSCRALFAPVNADGWMNYRRAFLRPRRRNSYTDGDFERFNAVLFPGGPEELEVYRWTPGRAKNAYRYESPPRRAALCLTVYDSPLDRFVIITAP